MLKTLCRISLEPDSCVSQTQTRFERWGVNSLAGREVRARARHHRTAARRRHAHRLAAVRRAEHAGRVALGRDSDSRPASCSGRRSSRCSTRLDRIGGVAGAVVGAALAGYVLYKWWERLRFYRTLRMARISVADLYELIQAGAQPSIVDVRSPTARALEPRWIPGAIHVPIDAVGRHMRTSAEGPRDRPLLHVPERSLRGAGREDPGQSRLQAGAPPVRRSRCLDRRGLCGGDGSSRPREAARNDARRTPVNEDEAVEADH